MMKEINLIDQDMIDMFQANIVINGGNYCRKHLRISCHVCQVTYERLHEEENQNQKSLGLRNGDDGLDTVSIVLTRDVDSAILDFKNKHQQHRDENGNDFFDGELLKNARQNEENINSRSLAECSQCSYYKYGVKDKN